MKGTGTLYAVGVGPGDPELMTLKAVRLIRENDWIALPGEDPAASTAYRIAVSAVPELTEKHLLAIPAPMTRDPERLAAAHQQGARILTERLFAGDNVVYLTLGDPTVYCSFSYLQEILQAEGYPVEYVSGVPSFCAAAARLGIPLASDSEPIYIYPASAPEQAPGTTVLMKSGRQLARVKEMLHGSGRTVQAVINCGMPDEQVCRKIDEIPDDAGYFTLMIAK